MSFLGELKRRKTFQVAAIYTVVAWLLVQVASTVEGPLNLPDWVDTLVILLLVIGFPIALVLSWAFNLTPDGIVKEDGLPMTVPSGGRRGEYVLTGLLVVALTWIGYREFGASEDDTAAVLAKSIAILPCDNFSTDTENAFFAASLHEELLNQLFKLRELSVIARTSVLQYAGAQRPIPEIADELRVESVMECSVAYGDGRIVVTAQLIDGETGLHLWSERYNREFADVFAIQADIAMNVASAMAMELSLEERAAIEREPTASTEAFVLFLRAREMMPTDRNAAIGLLREAVEMDPEFAEARALIALQTATSLINVSGQNAVGPDEREARIRAALEEADDVIAIDPELATPYLIKGNIDAFSWRWSEAAESFAHVPDSRREPSAAIGVLLGALEGRPEESIEAARNVVRLNPGSVEATIILAYALHYAGRTTESRQALQDALEIAPSHLLAHHWLALVEISLGSESAGLSELRLLEQLMGENRITVLLPELAYAYARVGQAEDAARIHAELEQRPDPQAIGVGGWIHASLAIGDIERAKSLLRTAIQKINDHEIDEGFWNLMGIRANTLGDPLLEEPEFASLRAQLRGD
jgi:adenylate cyclase